MYGFNLRPVKRMPGEEGLGVYVFRSHRRPWAWMLVGVGALFAASWSYMMYLHYAYYTGGSSTFISFAIAAGIAIALCGCWVFTQRKHLRLDVATGAVTLRESNIFGSSERAGTLGFDSRVEQASYTIRSPGAYPFTASVVLVYVRDRRIVLFAGTFRTPPDEYIRKLADLGISVTRNRDRQTAWFWEW